MVKKTLGVVDRTGKKYLHEPKPGMIYVRKGGRYLGKIEAPGGTPDFDREYWEILTGRKSEPKTSWKALIASYRASYRWLNLKPRTRQTYEHVLHYMVEKNGSKDIRRLKRPDVIAAQEANSHRAKFANDIPRILSVLCEHAIDLGWIDGNPAKGVKKKKIPEDRQRPHVPWTDEAVSIWRARAEGRSTLIFELGLGSIQRPGDWVDFLWGGFDGSNLKLDQNKTGKHLLLPCSVELKAALEAEKRRLGAEPLPNRPILVSLKGCKLTYSGMSGIMLDERKRLGLMKHDLHALRYRGIMELAWAGCNDDEIMAYSGHDTKEMVIKYAGLARQIMRAASAAEKRRLWASA